MDFSLKYLKIARNNTYDDVKSLFLFHSNKIEGSTFDLAQLEQLVTQSVVSGSHALDDVIETKNSIQLFDYIVESANEELTIFKIREYHSILKKGTRDEEFGLVGRFKLVPNKLSGVDLKLTEPHEVEEKLITLLNKYSGKMNLEDIARFHKEFELIHPFNDGNGRIGRFLILEQCIKNNIDYILIDEKNEKRYKTALYEAQKENEVNKLIDEFKDAQKNFKSQAEFFMKTRETNEKEINDWAQKNGLHTTHTSPSMRLK